MFLNELEKHTVNIFQKFILNNKTNEKLYWLGYNRSRTLNL